MPYIPLMHTSVCIDDQNSLYYNQLLDQAKIKMPDWRSAEQMRQTPPPQKLQKPQKGAGSCIFMHIWRGPDVGTAGCIAMAESHLAEIVDWLDPVRKPVIALFLANIYHGLQKHGEFPLEVVDSTLR